MGQMLPKIVFSYKEIMDYLSDNTISICYEPDIYYYGIFRNHRNKTLYIELGTLPKEVIEYRVLDCIKRVRFSEFDDFDLMWHHDKIAKLILNDYKKGQIETMF